MQNGEKIFGKKIDEAILVSEDHPLIDGETFVTEIISRFQTMRD